MYHRQAIQDVLEIANKSTSYGSASVNFDPPSQDKVAAGAQCDEERAEDEEVDVELRKFDVEFAQHVVRLAEQAESGVFETAVERLPVEAVYRLKHALKSVPIPRTPNEITNNFYFYRRRVEVHNNTIAISRAIAIAPL